VVGVLRLVFTGQYAEIENDDDDSKSYVRPLLQLETVASVLMIRPGKQFSFQITTERTALYYNVGTG